MEQATIFDKNRNMYWETTQLNTTDLSNKLFCTFVTEEALDFLIEDISKAYSIMYNKMFVLFVKSTNEYVITYNVDQGNVENIPVNTILVHRKKESNVLYTVNALNELIKSLNGGVVDTNFRIDWQHYRNSILITNHGDFKQLKTKLHKIIDLP